MSHSPPLKNCLTLLLLLCQFAWPLPATALQTLRQQPPAEDRSGLEELENRLQYDPGTSATSAAGLEEKISRRRFLGRSIGAAVGGIGLGSLGAWMVWEGTGAFVDYQLLSGQSVTLKEQMIRLGEKFGILKKPTSGNFVIWLKYHPGTLAATDIEAPFAYASLDSPQTLARVLSMEFSPPEQIEASHIQADIPKRVKNPTLPVAPPPGVQVEVIDVPTKLIQPIFKGESEEIDMTLQPMEGSTQTTLRVGFRLPDGQFVNSSRYDEFHIRVSGEIEEISEAQLIATENRRQALSIMGIVPSPSPDESPPLPPPTPDAPLEEEMQGEPLPEFSPRAWSLSFPPFPQGFSARRWERFGTIDALAMIVRHRKGEPFRLTIGPASIKRSAGYAEYQYKKRLIGLGAGGLTGVGLGLLGFRGGWKIGDRLAQRGSVSIPQHPPTGPSSGLEEPRMILREFLVQQRGPMEEGLVVLMGPTALEGSEGIPALWPLLMQAAPSFSPEEKERVWLYAENETLRNQLREAGYAQTSSDLRVVKGWIPSTDLIFYTTGEEWLLRGELPLTPGSETIILTPQNFRQELAGLLVLLGYPTPAGLEELIDALDRAA